jgi:glycosyltransferase involved in cell wall biosynthesis
MLISYSNNSLKVLFYQRKQRNNNFSVEILFDIIRKNFSSNILSVVQISSWESSGLIKRLQIGLEANRRQEKDAINHVTGDINFLPLFLNKRRTITTILDVGFMTHSNPMVRFILKLFWIKAAVHRSNIVTTISQATKDELLKYEKCNPNKIRVVYVPVSSNFKLFTKQFNEKCPTILQVGTNPNKNVPRLIEAVKDINCQLDIVGNLTEEMQSLLKKYQVKYLNSSRIPEEALIQKYQSCDILSFMSTYEGFGMPIVEANIVGKPVITSKLLSMPEVAGGSAHLVDPYDVEDMRKGILRLIEDEGYREQLIKLGFENHQRFDATEIARQFEQLYQKLY